MSPFGPLIAFGALLGAAWLVTRTRIGDWVGHRVDKQEPQRLKDPIYALLRREVQLRGQELEAEHPDLGEGSEFGECCRCSRPP